MRSKFRPLSFLLALLWFASFIFLAREISSLRYLDQVQDYLDKGVSTFTPTSIYTQHTESSKIRSHHISKRSETRYIVKYTSPTGYVHKESMVTRSSAEKLQSEGPIQRRILANTAEKTYLTIDGSLTKDDYIYQERIAAFKMMGYWLVILAAILFVFYRMYNKKAL